MVIMGCAWVQQARNLSRVKSPAVVALLTVFLDDGGVMSDNHTRATQWQHLVGEFFAPLVGGGRGRARGRAGAGKAGLSA